MVVCSGRGEIFLETLSLLLHTRHRFGSSEPITVAHCNELSNNMKRAFSKISNVSVQDVCEVGTFDASVISSGRMAGFFCKPAALLAVKHERILLMDSDVVWFRNPRLLFESPQFVSTGTLFFRDRWTQTPNRLTLTKATHRADRLLEYVRKLGKQFAAPNDPNYLNYIGNETLMLQTNAYWRHALTGNGLSLDHMQDSSVVLLDKSQHPRLLQVLRAMLPTFDVGYGDKEMYWLAATAAGEPFAFEGHVAGSLGDCGAIVHYSPGPAETEPFYTNAEYLVDLKKLNQVGDFLAMAEASHSPHHHWSSDGDSTTLTQPIEMNEVSTPVFVLHPWKKMSHGFYPCSACKHAACSPAPSHVVEEVLLRQKLMLALKAALGLGNDLSNDAEVFERFVEFADKELPSLFQQT